MSNILTGFNMQGNDPIDNRIVSPSKFETLEEYLQRVPIQKRYYGLSFYALDENNELRHYTFQTSLIEPTIDDDEEEIERLDKELQEHVNNKEIHKTSEEIRSEIVDADIPDTIARVQWTLDKIEEAVNTVMGDIVDGASDEYNTLKKIQDKIVELRTEVESQLYGDDGGEVLKTLEQALKFLNQYKDFIVDIPDNYVNKQDIVDNLNTDDPTKVLSARQGKVLSETLTNYFDSAMASIRAETNRATNAENRIEAKLDSEIDRSTAEDIRIQSELDAEEARAQSEEKRIEGKLDAEIERSTTKDTELGNQIIAETNRAEGEEQRIETKLDNEITRSTAKDADHDSRIEALEGETHVQNTDIGTTSQTFQLQMGKPGNKIKNEDAAISVRNADDSDYANFIAKNATFKGDLIVEGQSFVTEAETVEIKDNILLLNKGEAGSGVTKGMAGLQIDRGTEPDFQILFVESDRRFKAGEEGDLWCLALRDDDADMLNGMFTSWDLSTKRLKTTNIIPSDRKLAFTDNNSYLQLTSHSFSGDALNQTLRYSNSLGGIFISAGNTNLNLDTDKTGFHFHKNILLPSTISSVSDFLFKRSDVTKLSLKDTVAQFTVPVTAITFNRASDGSEVLYHADLENTEFKNYIIIAGPNDIKLYLKSTDEDNYNLISSVDQDGNKLSNMGYYGSYWAIENNRIAVYKYDANGYPEIINQDGTSPGYLRACTSGFLPNVSGNLASGGSGYLGTSSWAFANAYIANNHSNKYYFGTNDVFLDASTTRISAKTSGAAIGMNVGSLLVSNNYSDETKVPDNGTYSKGAIKSYTGFTSDFRISNLTITKTGSDVLHISSFASDPENIPGTDPISSQVINDGVALTYFWQGDYAFQLVGDIDGTGMAYRMYHPSTGTSTSWKFLADTNWVSNKITSVAGNYLPLAGGTMTGSIIMSNNITIQSKDSGGNSKRLIGKGSDNVTYIGDSDGHTFLYSDAADISHIRNGTSYRIWDASNLTSPLLYASGTTATPTTVYNRNLGVNGSQWTFLSAINAATTSIYAPTAAGTSGQVLTSTGGVPTWSNISSVGDSRYVLKSGDTMTGNLTMNGGWLQFSNNNWSDKGGAYKESEGSLKVWRVSTDAENKPSTYGSVLQINSRSGHWNTQLWIDQTNTAGNNGKLRYRSIKNYSSVEWNDWTVLATEDYVNSKAAGYLPLTGGTLSGALTMSSRRNNIVVDVVGGAGNTWDEGAGALSIQVPNDSGQTPLILARRSGAAINTTVATERLLSMELLDTGHSFIIGMSGSEALQLDWTSGKAGTGKLFGKQIATTDQIPTIPSISISNSGSGNAVTSISASGHTLTVTKGSTYLTSSALSGYATQSWANSQFAPLKNYFVTSNYASIATTGNEMCIGSLTSGNSVINVNYRNGTGTTSPSTWYWRAGSSTVWANAYWGNLYMNNALVATQSWASGQFPTKTGAGASGTWGISITGNADTATNSTQLGGTAAASYVKENDNISRLTNDRAYVRSTSTLRVNDIQVAKGEAGSTTGVLYVVLES